MKWSEKVHYYIIIDKELIPQATSCIKLVVLTSLAEFKTGSFGNTAIFKQPSYT